MLKKEVEKLKKDCNKLKDDLAKKGKPSDESPKDKPRDQEDSSKVTFANKCVCSNRCAKVVLVGAGSRGPEVKGSAGRSREES